LAPVSPEDEQDASTNPSAEQPTESQSTFFNISDFLLG